MNCLNETDLPCFQESIFFHQKKGVSCGNNDFSEADFECRNKQNSFRYIIVSNTSEDEQRNIETFSTQVSNSKDVETLLDHVNWRMFLQSCKRGCSSFTNTCSKIESTCFNSSTSYCCFSDSIDDLFFYFKQCGNTDCNISVNSFSSSALYILLILGTICLLGNVVVSYEKINSLSKSRSNHKEVRIYHVLVLNLALADLLMGIYFIAIAFEAKQKVANHIYFSRPRHCNALGILSTTSSQVSITIIFIISFYRLISLLIQTAPF